jgi:hypothetical protein
VGREYMKDFGVDERRVFWIDSAQNLVSGGELL